AERERWLSQRLSALPIVGAAVPPAEKRGRGPPAAECRTAEPAAQHSLLDQASSVLVNSPGPRDAARRAHQHHRNVGGPNRRLGAAACSAVAASNSIRPRCAACRVVGHEIPRSSGIYPIPARRRLRPTGPRLAALAPSAALAWRFPRRAPQAV